MSETSNAGSQGMQEALKLRASDDAAAALAVLDQDQTEQAADGPRALLRAQLCLDAGLPAVTAFERFLRIEPGNPTALLGLARALVAEGQPDQAVAVIAQVLLRQPFWVDGQVYLAKLRYMLGDPNPCTAIDRALSDSPAPLPLWQHRIALAMQDRKHAKALELVGRAEAATGPSRIWDAHRATCLDELGQLKEAGLAFAKVGDPPDATSAVRLVRHLLRSGNWAQVEQVARPFIASPSANDLWPYIALAWRLLGDSRIDWLEHQHGLVGTYDLGLASDELAQLADCLRRIHHLKHNPIDQSLRNGTQTDGYLFSRVEPEIRSFRSKLVEAVREHLASLPRRDPFHPILKHRRTSEVGFSGAWSVLLRDGGRHVSHVHPLGWFSSAFYVALPAPDPLNPDAGTLVLGEPDETLSLDLQPYRLIRPVPSRLVLFPSTMWHGTRRFDRGERLTIAFDVAQPV